MRKLSMFFLKLLGWKYELSVEIPDKCVICVAPHTSNWDYVIGMLYYLSVIGSKPNVLMKKELFFFPFNYIFKSLGGIPVDRKKKSSVSEQMLQWFNSKDKFRLTISPEGTRKKSAKWRTGFYYIATNAGVPIILAYIDYAKKKAGMNRIFYPTGDYISDLEEIKNHYKDVGAKHPHKFAI